MPTPGYRTVRDDFYSQPLVPVESVTLMGSKCQLCGEVFLGNWVACQNCQCDRLARIPLGRNGTLYSFTIVRNRPPGDFKGPVDPFVPYPVGLVDLPEGLRILAVLDCPISALTIGMPLTLSISELYRDPEGRSVLAHKFKADETGENR